MAASHWNYVNTWLNHHNGTKWSPVFRPNDLNFSQFVYDYDMQMIGPLYVRAHIDTFWVRMCTFKAPAKLGIYPARAGDEWAEGNMRHVFRSSTFSLLTRVTPIVYRQLWCVSQFQRKWTGPNLMTSFRHFDDWRLLSIMNVAQSKIVDVFSLKNISAFPASMSQK